MKTIDQFEPGENFTFQRRLLGYLTDNNGNKCGVVFKVRQNTFGPNMYSESVDVCSIEEANELIRAEAEYLAAQMRGAKE